MGGADSSSWGPISTFIYGFISSWQNLILSLGQLQLGRAVIFFVLSGITGFLMFHVIFWQGMKRQDLFQTAQLILEASAKHKTHIWLFMLAYTVLTGILSTSLILFQYPSGNLLVAGCMSAMYGIIGPYSLRSKAEEMFKSWTTSSAAKTIEDYAQPEERDYDKEISRIRKELSRGGDR